MFSAEPNLYMRLYFELNLIRENILQYNCNLRYLFIRIKIFVLCILHYRGM